MGCGGDRGPLRAIGGASKTVGVNRKSILTPVIESETVFQKLDDNYFFPLCDFTMSNKFLDDPTTFNNGNMIGPDGSASSRVLPNDDAI